MADLRGRRRFLAGLLASGLAPQLSWADAGRPAFLSGARRADGAFVICGLSAAGDIVFDCRLPGRGHAAAAHPARPEAVAFARRPGDFAVVLNCVDGREVVRLAAPDGRHFYGHGAFSRDGARLYTSENDYEGARGIVGVWDATRDYARVGEFLSGGAGPHDIRLMADAARLVVANGGIETHPDSGRSKLNLHAMRPNLSILSLEGRVISQHVLPPTERLNSIRHLAVDGQGGVVFAMQWQGDATTVPPVLGRRGDDGRVEVPRPERWLRAAMRGYAGSVAVSPDGREIAVTSPRGGVCQIWRDGAVQTLRLPDVCGVAHHSGGFVATTGQGRVITLGGGTATPERRHNRQFDNHLVALGA